MSKNVSILVKWFFVAILGAILTVVTFFPYVNYKCKKQFVIPNFAMILLIIAVSGLYLFFKLFKYAEIKRKFDFDFCVKVIAFVLLVVQFYVCYNIYFFTAWDAGSVFASAQAIVNGDSHEAINLYNFSAYPNNLGILFLEVLMLRINRVAGVFTTSQLPMCIIVVNCLLNALTCKLVYKTALLYLNKKCAFMAFLLCVALIGFSPWNVIYYSDTLGLIFPIAVFYFFSIPINKKCKRYTYRFLSVVLACFGYFIKPQCFIVFIAAIVIATVNVIDKKSLKGAIKVGMTLVCAAALFVLISTMLNALGERSGVELEKENQFGMGHFFMMGQNDETNGIYSEKDVEFSQTFENKKERNAADIKAGISRICKMGPVNYAKFIAKKTLVLFNDGTFAWGAEGSFYMSIPEPINETVSPFLRSVYYDNELGVNYKYLASFEQFVWLAILLFTFISAFSMDNRKSILMLAVIGLTIFQLLFEARARYIYTYVPIYCVLAAVGMHNINVFGTRIIRKFKVFNGGNYVSDTVCDNSVL